jgi:hypothetical protein
MAVSTPKKVKIAGQMYTIIERDRKEDGLLNEENYGYTLDTGNLIVIDKMMALGKKQQTVIHEIMHVIRMVFDGPKKPNKKDDYEVWEHHFIGIYEAGMLAFLKDNPEMVTWLLSED